MTVTMIEHCQYDSDSEIQVLCTSHESLLTATVNKREREALRFEHWNCVPTCAQLVVQAASSMAQEWNQGCYRKIWRVEKRYNLFRKPLMNCAQ